MEIQTFIKNFLYQFEEVPTETITEETNFRDLENWDSLAALAVVAMIDDDYGVALSFAEMKKCNTLSELFEAVKQKKD